MDFSKLQDLLDSQYTWPDKYSFKFVGNEGHRDELIKVIGTEPSNERPSKSGKYISFTFTVEILKSEDVITIYKNVSKISGIISL